MQRHAQKEKKHVMQLKIAKHAILMNWMKKINNVYLLVQNAKKFIKHVKNMKQKLQKTKKKKIVKL